MNTHAGPKMSQDDFPSADKRWRQTVEERIVRRAADEYLPVGWDHCPVRCSGQWSQATTGRYIPICRSPYDNQTSSVFTLRRLFFRIRESNSAGIHACPACPIFSTRFPVIPDPVSAVPLSRSRLHLGYQLVDHVAVNVGEAEVAALEAVGQLGVVEAQ